MITLRDRFELEDFRFAKSNFIDDFRASPSFLMVKDSILDLENLNDIQKSIIAATVDQICGECNVDRPEWVFDPSTYLKSPYFAMNAKGGLRLVLLQESPCWFRSRNLFVSENCSMRV